jgi:hypothetical protein
MGMGSGVATSPDARLVFELIVCPGIDPSRRLEVAGEEKVVLVIRHRWD